MTLSVTALTVKKTVGKDESFYDRAHPAGLGDGDLTFEYPNALPARASNELAAA